MTARIEQQPAQRPAPLDWPTLAGLTPPEREWTIKLWLGLFITLMVGPGGIGKTLLAQMMGTALALGVPFIDEITRSFRVLFWGCEDDRDEFWRRQVPIVQHFGAGLEALQDNLIVVPRLGFDNTLVTTEYGDLKYTPLLDELRQQAHDTRAEVVILDNVAQLFGINENDRHQVTASLNAVAGALPGKAVLLLAHPARAAGSEFSGSGAWENAARSRLFMGTKLPDQQDTEPAQENVRYLARRKANYTSRDWRRFTYQNGVLVPDPVEAAAASNGGVVDHLRRRAAERIVLDAVRRLHAMNLYPAEGTRGERYLPRMMAQYSLSEGRTQSELARAMRDLIADGRLLIGQVGQYSNRTPMNGLRLAE